ncbi:MAG: DUF4912 domain-containing protein [Treponema sp.]|nr:DUF4912 domain-containing protein [Treponema sp.]
MEEAAVTRARLESLATDELVRLADSLGIDIPPDLDRVFVIEELLEFASSGGRGEEAPDISAEASIAGPPFTEPAEGPLPGQYNVTFIEVLIRDPFWAFVFWEIKTQDREQFESGEDFEGYRLKVSPVGPVAGAGGTFTVPVREDDTARYLGLNPQRGQPGQRYKVELCAGPIEGETVLAVSSPFTLPVLHDLPAGWEAQPFAAENPALTLSGYGEFRVHRGNERLLRKKKSSTDGSP